MISFFVPYYSNPKTRMYPLSKLRYCVSTRPRCENPDPKAFVVCRSSLYLAGRSKATRWEVPSGRLM